MTLTDRRDGRTMRLTPARLGVLTCASLLAAAVLCQQGLTDPHHIDWVPVTIGAVVRSCSSSSGWPG